MTVLIALPDGDGWSFTDDGPQSALTASAIPVKPPKFWFDDPALDQPTALTVTTQGRVLGHAAAWGIRHVGLPGCRTAPRSTTNYRHYRTGQVECEDGSMVATGRLSMGGGHADINGDLVAAVSHYDDVSTGVADLAVGEDAHGIWMAGALRPEVTPEQIRTLRASSVSGDWRSVDGRNLEMCGLLAVNLPGFSVPRASLAASGAEVTSLVAAGAMRSTIVIHPAPEEAIMTDQATDSKPDAAETPMLASGALASIGGTDYVGIVGDIDGDIVTLSVEVPRGSLSAASETQKAMVSSGVKMRLRDREYTARFDELSARMSAAEQRAEAAERRANGVEALAHLDAIG